MKIPKQIKTYCKKCKKHEAHKLSQYKGRGARPMSVGTRKFQRKHKSGYGGKAKIIGTVKKQNKKPTFIAECMVCKSKRYFVIPKKMKKTELKTD